MAKEAQYYYNAAGNRVMKAVRKQGGAFEFRVYIDGFFEYFTDETDEQNTIHIMDDKSRIAKILVGDAMGEAPVQYVLDNNIGSSMVLLAPDRSIVNVQEYYPFGETSFGCYGKKRYQYCGKEKDSESGLYYYGARYYAPWTCRFTSVDPLAADYPQLTPYNYAGNKPITHKDIEGLQGTGDTRQGGGGNGGVTVGTGSGPALIDSGATITDKGTAVIAKDGTKFVNLNGVGLVQESLLEAQNIKPLNPSATMENKTDYVYNASDLQTRSDIMSVDSPIKTAVLSMEKEGNFQPLALEGFKKQHGDWWKFVSYAMFSSHAWSLASPSALPMGSSLSAPKGLSLSTSLKTPVKPTQTSTGSLARYDTESAIKSGLKMDGTYDFDTVRSMIPEGTSNTFRPSSRIGFGEKYDFGINTDRIQLKWHTPDAGAPSGSNSSLFNTAQIKLNNKLLRTDGTFVRRPSNETHLKLKP